MVDIEDIQSELDVNVARKLDDVIAYQWTCDRNRKVWMA